MINDSWQPPAQLGSTRALVLAALLLSIGGCASTGGSTASTEALLSPQAAIAAGDEAARREDFERALAHYLRAVSTEETVEGWLRVGAVCTRLGYSERALQAYLKVVALDPLHVEALEGAGLEYVALGNVAAAREQLARVVGLDGRRWRSHNALGVLADRAEDHTAAIAHYEAALGVNPQSPMLLNNLGYSRYLSGDLDQSARDFYAATRLNQNYKPAWSNLAMVYAHQGWYADAVGILARATDKATAYNDIGYIAYRRGDLVESEQLLSEAVRLSPTYYETAYRNLESVRIKLRSQGQTEVASTVRADGG
jgi:Flp pilus assembly protein TadD